MIRELRIQGFKSWADSGRIRLGKLTGFFGANSSGKTALLQNLLLLKQTVESADRSRVLELGGERAYTDLGTLYDVVYRHELPGNLGIDLRWSPLQPLPIPDPERESGTFTVSSLGFSADISVEAEAVTLAKFEYRFDYKDQVARLGMVQSEADPTAYQAYAKGFELRRVRQSVAPLPAPVKSYGFPDQVFADYQNASFLSELVLAFQRQFERLYYLGPLREYPQRSYAWTGEGPQGVGRRGESAIPALLAARQRGIRLPLQVPLRFGESDTSLEERVALWLRDLGLIESFVLRPIPGNRKVYEVFVRRSAQAPEVYITDVGTGVSQVLPVLVLCYYAPEGSTILLEHPEIHLHPSVQAGLADVFIDAIKTRNVQIILESHSEHLLRRLQRRIAEEQIDAEDNCVYFVEMNEGTSALQRLELDTFGNIRNWPEDFFGDEMGDLVAQTQAEMARRDLQEVDAL